MSDHQRGRYERFIASRPRRDRAPGLEHHHILPVALGGPDAPENMIWLTPKEHLLAHYMLARAYGGPMVSALFLMSTMGKYKVGARLYAQAKAEFCQRQSQRVGEKNNRWGTTHSEETKRVMVEKATGRIHSEKTRKKLSEQRVGRPSSPAAMEALVRIAKENNPFKGKVHSEETKSIMVHKALAYKYTCPHCGKTGGRVMHRWHGDRCKMKDSHD